MTKAPRWTLRECEFAYTYAEALPERDTCLGTCILKLFPGFQLNDLNILFQDDGSLGNLPYALHVGGESNGLALRLGIEEIIRGRIVVQGSHKRICTGFLDGDVAVFNDG